MRDCGYARFPQAWKVHTGRQTPKLDEETRWQITGEAIEELQKAPMRRDLVPSTGPQARELEGETGEIKKAAN
jgi:hypothetical protein